MKQTEIIAQLRSLRESQADFARTNGDEIFQRDVEALDAAIEELERIRWRRVGDETPEMGPYDSNENVLTFNMADDGRFRHMVSDTVITKCGSEKWRTESVRE